MVILAQYLWIALFGPKMVILAQYLWNGRSTLKVEENETQLFKLSAKMCQNCHFRAEKKALRLKHI